VGIDNLNAAAGILLRTLGRVDKVTYYVIDYTPRRFANFFLNALYHGVDRFCARKADVVWNLSERMREVRAGQGVEPRKNQLVPVGVALQEILRRKPRAGARFRLLYMGALQENKGVQLLIQAMPGILAKVPKARLDVIGFGPYEGALKGLASQSPARGAISFPGGLSHQELFARMASYGVALAPYVEEPDSYSYWCDPTKPKEYLACGLPLVITRVPWLWKLVDEPSRPMGVAVDYDPAALAAACVRLMTDQAFYARCRRNALAFGRTLEWDGIFDRALRESPWTGSRS
jgi:glycosyltransferase involved in cell wall biosynthesis